MLFEQVPHWCGMMSRVGRFGKASAAPPVAGDVSAALPRMVRNSRRLMGSSSDRHIDWFLTFKWSFACAMRRTTMTLKEFKHY